MIAVIRRRAVGPRIGQPESPFFVEVSLSALSGAECGGDGLSQFRVRDAHGNQVSVRADEIRSRVLGYAVAVRRALLGLRVLHHIPPLRIVNEPPRPIAEVERSAAQEPLAPETP